MVWPVSQAGPFPRAPSGAERRGAGQLAKMALPSRLRRCPGPVRAFSAHLLAATARPGRAELEPRGPAALTGARPPARFCASDEPSRRRGPPGAGGGRSVVVVGIPNPFIWVRTRLYCFLIRAYFDQEFSVEEFTQGAKQVTAGPPRLQPMCRGGRYPPPRVCVWGPLLPLPRRCVCGAL